MEIIWQGSHGLQITKLNGEEARNYKNDIAQMRIEIFREFPYLYDGNLTYESDYLECYFRAKSAYILLVFDNYKVVGFSSAIALNDEMAEIKAPFIKTGVSIPEYLYIGEFVLYPLYRGKGLLRIFMEYHESHAKGNGYSQIGFMTVERSNNHPMKPNKYETLEPVWRHFGFDNDIKESVILSWQQIDTASITMNKLKLWSKVVE